MEISKEQKIGTHFKKENIFLATVVSVSNVFLSSEQFDIFYKDDRGYTRFVEEGPETFVGDNSDGKGIVRNVVPIWEYYSKEQVFECMLNNEFMAICVLDIEPLYKYNNDYNKA